MRKRLGELYPLLFAKEGERIVVSELRGGKHFKDKCINQGIIPGQVVEIFNNSGNGPCILNVNNSRVMVGHTMMNRILVKSSD